MVEVCTASLTSWVGSGAGTRCWRAEADDAIRPLLREKALKDAAEAKLREQEAAAEEEARREENYVESEEERPP